MRSRRRSVRRSGRFALHHAVAVADKLHVQPFLVGITLVAIGTDIPEVINSLVSSHLGYGEINVGDSIGSVFTQGSLAPGLFPVVAHSALRVERREVLLIPALTVAALGVGALVLRDGAISRADPILLIVAWVAGTSVAWRCRASAVETVVQEAAPRGAFLHVMLALLALTVVSAEWDLTPTSLPTPEPHRATVWSTDSRDPPECRTPN